MTAWTTSAEQARRLRKRKDDGGMAGFQTKSSGMTGGTQFAVKLFLVADHEVYIVLGCYQFPAESAHFGAERGVFQEFKYFLFGFIRVFGFNKITAFAVLNYLPRSVHRVGYNRQGGAHGFKHRAREPLPERGQHKNIRHGEQFGYISSPAEKFNGIF